MNLYVRYFDHETLAHNLDEIKSFLATIHEIKVNNDMINRIADFRESDNLFPFRLKVSYSNYILFLKTPANNLAEFKALEKARKEQRNDNHQSMADKKRSQLEILNEINPGWYEGKILFKRVVLNPITSKCRYVDTVFRVRCKASCPMECYDRMIDHLRNRPEIDPRSQFPSAKSNNFEYTFIGANDADAYAM